MKLNKNLIIQILFILLATVGYILWGFEQSFTTVNILIICIPMAVIGTLSAFIFGICLYTRSN